MASQQVQDNYMNPAVRPPRLGDLSDISRDLGLCCTDMELEQYKAYIDGMLKGYNFVYKMAAPKLPVKYPRTPGYRPSPEENKYNAWYQKCEIAGAPDGPLAGKRVAMKDNICVAGVPMMNGSKLLEGFIPDEDATVVTKVLDAGGRIVGKTTAENMCISGTSFTNDTGPILNSHDTARSCGGSSSGSAVVLLTGEADMALGGDQGGSIRMPASWSGVVGLKPTFGLVPYTGAVGMEVTVDHMGPMAKTVRDCALLLEVIAGYDGGRDPRQPRDLVVPRYSQLLTDDLSGQKVGLVTEGFDICDADVQQLVKEAANKLTKAGALVEDVSIPLHANGDAIRTPIISEGTYRCMLRGNGYGYHYKGHYSEGMIEKLREGFQTHGRDLSDPVKMTCLFGEYIYRNYGNKFYAKAHGLNEVLTQAYDDALDKYDVIVMPTLPYKAPLLPKEDSTIYERIKAAQGMLSNTGPFNTTGHPAISVNAGMSEGLPVGMMIVGKHFEDTKVLNVAYAFENLLGLH